MIAADLDIPAWLAALLLEQERDKRQREQRVGVVLPVPNAPQDEEE